MLYCCNKDLISSAHLRCVSREWREFRRDKLGDEQHDDSRDCCLDAAREPTRELLAVEGLDIASNACHKSSSLAAPLTSALASALFRLKEPGGETDSSVLLLRSRLLSALLLLPDDWRNRLLARRGTKAGMRHVVPNHSSTGCSTIMSIGIVWLSVG